MTKNLFIHNEFLPYLRHPCHNASSVPLYSVYTLILSSKRCSHTKAPHVKLLEVHCNIHNFAMCPIFRKCFRKNAYLLLFCNTFKIAEAGSPSRSAMQAKQGMPTEPSALASWSICDQKMPWTKMQCPIGSPWLAVKHWWWTAVQSCLTSHKTWCGHNFWILHILTQMWILNSIDSYISGLHRSSIVLQFCQTCSFFQCLFSKFCTGSAGLGTDPRRPTKLDRPKAEATPMLLDAPGRFCPTENGDQQPRNSEKLPHSYEKKKT